MLGLGASRLAARARASVKRLCAAVVGEGCSEVVGASLCCAPAGCAAVVPVRTKTKKSSGKASQGSGSPGKRLGVKKWELQFAKPHDNIYLQRGTHYLPGPGTAVARDQRIYAIAAGKVRYKPLPYPYPRKRKLVVVEPVSEDHSKMIELRIKERKGLERRKQIWESRQRCAQRRDIVPQYAEDMVLHLKRLQALHSRQRSAADRTKEWIF